MGGRGEQAGLAELKKGSGRVNKQQRKWGLKDLGAYPQLVISPDKKDDTNKQVDKQADPADSESKSFEGEIIAEEDKNASQLSNEFNGVVEEAIRELESNDHKKQIDANKDSDFVIGHEVAEKFLDLYPTESAKKKAISKLEFFEYEIRKKADEMKEKGEVPDYDAISSQYFTDLFGSSRAEAREQYAILKDYYLEKIKNKSMPKKQPEGGSMYSGYPGVPPEDMPDEDEETEAPEFSVPKDETVIKGGNLKDKKPTLKPDNKTGKNPKSPDKKSDKPFWQFEKKYGDIYQTDLFSGFEFKGDWMHISDYNEKTEKAACYFGKANRPERFNDKKELSWEELDEILKKYPYAKPKSKREKIERKKPDKKATKENPESQKESELTDEEKEAIALYAESAEKMLKFIESVDYVGKYGYEADDKSGLIETQKRRYWKKLREQIKEDGLLDDEKRVDLIIEQMQKTIK